MTSDNYIHLILTKERMCVLGHLFRFILICLFMIETHINQV